MPPFRVATFVLSLLSICIHITATAVSHWWQDPKSQPGLWFRSYMHTCHMDNPAATSLRLSWAEAGSSYGNIFLCVCVSWFCQTSCFNYSSLLMNKWKGETSKVAKYSVLVTNTEGFFLMCNQKVGLRFTPLICSWLFFLYIKKRNSCFLQLTVFFLKRNRHREITYLWRLLSKKTISIHIKKLIQRN